MLEEAATALVVAPVSLSHGEERGGGRGGGRGGNRVGGNVTLLWQSRCSTLSATYTSKFFRKSISIRYNRCSQDLVCGEISFSMEAQDVGRCTNNKGQTPAAQDNKASEEECNRGHSTTSSTYPSWGAILFLIQSPADNSDQETKLIQNGRL